MTQSEWLEKYYMEVLNEDGFFGPWSEIPPETKKIVENSFEFARWRLRTAFRKLFLLVCEEIGVVWVYDKLEKWLAKK